MNKRLRFLLDTNILIPLQDSYVALESSLANFVRLAGTGGHQLLYHPASKLDIERDKDEDRRLRTLIRLQQYEELTNVSSSHLNTTETSDNDRCDNNILHALECSAVHALITEDKGIHNKARKLGLINRVYNIQTAEDWLRRLHETTEVHLPNISNVPLYSLTEQLSTPFFDSLKLSYDSEERSFETWFREKAQDGRRAWVSNNNTNQVEAICIYAIQNNETINKQQKKLRGKSLKLCTFKVGEQIRGQKIGELFLKAAFKYATENFCENIFIHTSTEQTYLLALLKDFGFEQDGIYGEDIVLVKSHPKSPPQKNDIPAIDYARLYFPHFRYDCHIDKFIIPIQPQYHDVLFPDIVRQPQLFDSVSSVGNAIKQAYLCKAMTNQLKAGDIVLFYRTQDEKAITTIGIVEHYETLDDPLQIMQLVSRRTVYSQTEIEAMSGRPIKVLLFRAVKHLDQPIEFSTLKSEEIINGAIQSITKISNDSFTKLHQFI